MSDKIGQYCIQYLSQFIRKPSRSVLIGGIRPDKGSVDNYAEKWDGWFEKPKEGYTTQLPMLTFRKRTLSYLEMFVNQKHFQTRKP